MCMCVCVYVCIFFSLLCFHFFIYIGCICRLYVPCVSHWCAAGTLLLLLHLWLFAHDNAEVLSPTQLTIVLSDVSFGKLNIIISNVIGRNSRRFCALRASLPS